MPRRRTSLSARAPPAARSVTSSMPSSATALTRSSARGCARCRWRGSCTQALRLQGVGVRAAAGDDAPRLVAAGSQRGLGGEHRRLRRGVPVADEEPLHVDVHVASTAASFAASWHASTISATTSSTFASSSERASARTRQCSATTFVPPHPSVDAADVRRRLGVKPPERHGRDRRGRPPPWPSARPPGGSRRARPFRGTRLRSGGRSARP